MTRLAILPDAASPLDHATAEAAFDAILEGKAGEFVAAHDLTYKGDFPLNTHGGQLSFGQPGLAGGMSHVTEAARQVMGVAGARQVPDCDISYVNGNGGIMSEQVSLILGRNT